MSDNNKDEKKDEIKENVLEKKEEDKAKKDNSNKIDYFKTDIEKDENLSKYIDVDNKKKPKYRLNFSKIIKSAKSNSSSFEYYSEIEYNCNICLNSSLIDMANKINAFSLLSYINFNNEFYDNLFYLNNRIIKLLGKDKGIEAFIFIRTLYRASKILFEKYKNYFHSYYYANLALIIKDKSKIDQDSIRLLNKLMTTLKEDTEEYIIKKQNLFMNPETFNSEKINSLKEILNNIGKNNINNDDNLYYVINKNWVDRACNFFNEYERLINLKKDEDFAIFMDKSFKFNNIYSKYIGEELTNLTIEDSDKNIPFFPGPIDNYSITVFKDFWSDSELKNVQNNFFIKEGLEINKNYYLINKNTWISLNEIFQSTNEIKRKGDNNDLMILKCIIFEKNLQKKENVNHLRRKYIQISKKQSVNDLKEKILRSINDLKKTYKQIILKLKQKDNDYKENKLSDDKNDEKNDLEDINSKTKTIHFFECSYEKKDILSEMIIAYSNSIQSIKYDIKKLDINESLLMEEFPCNGLRKNNNLLLIEIKDENEENFLNENDNKCSECGKEIEKETEFKCEKCNLNQYCSYLCSKTNKTHIKIDESLDNFLIEEFSLIKLFQKNLQDIVKEGSNHGLSGLINLGNTCFMNSVIQCLSNTEDLTKYFLLDFYQQEMNLGNRLGSNGNLVESYSKLINLLWNDEKNKIIDPTFFISQIIKKLNQYRYNNQQDAHEFLSLFIDNLHEDINRISNKPYIELKERQENEDDEKASYRWWKSHRLRENSIISDLFYGQLKSNIKCLKCNRNSITFDPFMFLGLSLPISSFKIKLKFFYMKNCYSIDFLIWGDCRIYDLKNRCFELNVLKELNIEKDYNLIDAVVLNKDKFIISIVKNNEELVYNYLKEDKEICLFIKDSLDSFNIYCYPVIIISEDSIFFGRTNKINFVSYPIGISVNNNTTIENLKNSIYSQLSHMLNVSKEYNLDDIFNLLIYHNFKEKGFSFNFFSTKPTCEFCHQKFNQSSPFCSLNKQFKDNDKLEPMISQFKNNRPLILLFYSKYFYEKESAYINADMIIKHFIPIQLIENAETTTLYNSLDLFQAEEKLNDNGWYCNKCKEHTQAIKKLNIYRAPNYLIIHFKRFRIRNGIKGQQFGRKNEVFISYPINNLDLSDYVIGPNKNKAIYNLYGVVEHFGGLSQGHYIAKCKNFGKWYQFNDSDVDEINDNIVSKNAYLLFYKRKGLENEF